MDVPPQKKINKDESPQASYGQRTASNPQGGEMEISVANSTALTVLLPLQSLILRLISIIIGWMIGEAEGRKDRKIISWRHICLSLGEHSSQTGEYIHENIPPLGDQLIYRGEGNVITRYGFQNIRGTNIDQCFEISAETCVISEMGANSQ